MSSTRPRPTEPELARRLRGPKLAQSGAVLSRRQDLPAAAHLPVDKLQRVYAKTPDVASCPLCRNLTAGSLQNTRMPLARSWAESQPRSGVGEMPRARAFSALGLSDMGAFWDWGSLHQRHGGERTAEQDAAFHRALNGTMDLWYAHRLITKVFVTELPRDFVGDSYEQRGWPFFERSSAELITPQFAGGRFWPMCIDLRVGMGGHGRQLPRTPAAFADGLAERKFTNDADSSTVIELYEKTATAILGEATTLDYGKLRPPRGAGTALAAALCMAPRLRALYLRVRYAIRRRRDRRAIRRAAARRAAASSRICACSTCSTTR